MKDEAYKQAYALIGKCQGDPRVHTAGQIHSSVKDVLAEAIAKHLRTRRDGYVQAAIARRLQHADDSLCSIRECISVADAVMAEVDRTEPKE